jgi:flagellar FliJ protein
MVPKTRLDRLVQLRARREDSALQNLAHARSSLGRAAERLAGLRQDARSDGRGRGAAELWVVEECAHVRTIQALRAAERELALAVQREQVARAGFTAAHRSLQVVRKAKDKKVTEILDERERREQRALDEAATLRFNSSR